MKSCQAWSGDLSAAREADPANELEADRRGRTIAGDDPTRQHASSPPRGPPTHSSRFIDLAKYLPVNDLIVSRVAGSKTLAVENESRDSSMEPTPPDRQFHNLLKTNSLSKLHKDLFNLWRNPLLSTFATDRPGLFLKLFHRICGELRAKLRLSMKGATILVVEDEAAIAEVLEYNLDKEGFDVAVEYRGDTALNTIRRQPPDLVVLDLMLPGLDGLELTRTLKRDPKTASIPLVMLTAKGEELDRIVGLELGADDYIPKPFSPREVVLRIKAVLRRAEGAPESRDQLVAGELTLDVPGHRLLVEGEEVALTATEFRLLRILMERGNRVQTRNTLLADVWAYAEDVDSRTVDTHIRRLRRKLGPEADRIETVIGVGYRLRC